MFQVIGNHLTNGSTNVVAAGPFKTLEDAKAHALALNCKPFNPYFYRVISNGHEINS